MPKKARPFKYMIELGKRLETARGDCGLTRVAMGQIMGVSANAVKSWEAGISEPPLGYLDYLVEVHGYTLDWLMYGQSETVMQPQSDLEKELLLENRELRREIELLRRKELETTELGQHKIAS